jgi:dienelactone hydrolase
MALADYAEDTFTWEGSTRRIFRRGSGPAVLVIHEIPGITPAVLAFADRVAELGCTAVLPSLLGKPGGGARDPRRLASAFVTLCISREFNRFVLCQASPVTEWLRALGRHEHERCGGPGIGVVGMCFSGGFALAMMVDDDVLAPVLSQPSLPLGLTCAHRRDLGISDDALATVKERAAAGACILGMRFTWDSLVPPKRFARLRKELGDAFVEVKIDSSPGNSHGIPPWAHSVLTEDLNDTPGHPTRAALEQVLQLFRTRLLTTS